MNLVEVLELKYPGKVGIWKEIEVGDRGDGNLFISNWDMGAEPQPTEQQINQWKVEYEEEYQLKVIRDKRARAYPSIQDQLDMLYHDKVDGTNLWAAAIADVKTEYSKPEESI